MKAKKHDVWFQQREVHKRPAVLSPLASTEWGLTEAELQWQKWFFPWCLNCTHYRTSKLEKHRDFLCQYLIFKRWGHQSQRDVWLCQCGTMRTRAGHLLSKSGDCSSFPPQRFIIWLSNGWYYISLAITFISFSQYFKSKLPYWLNLHSKYWGIIEIIKNQNNKPQLQWRIAAIQIPTMAT